MLTVNDGVDEQRCQSDLNRGPDVKASESLGRDLSRVDESIGKIASCHLNYVKLEPRLVLTVIGNFNGGTGALDITLDADFDTAVLSHDGVNVFLNGSKDLDPLTGGSQEAPLGAVTSIQINGDLAKFGQAVDVISDFDVFNGVNLGSFSIADVSDATFQGHVEVAGNLGIGLAGGGLLSDVGAGKLTVGGSSILDAGDGSIELDNPQNAFLGIVDITAAGSPFDDATISGSGDILLGDVDVDGDLRVTSTGEIRNPAATMIDVDGLTVLTADDGIGGNFNNDITIGTIGGDFVDIDRLTFSTVDDVTIDADSSVVFANSNLAGNLDVDSVGLITNDPNASILVAGNSHFEAPSIAVGHQFNDYFDTISLTLQSTGDATIETDFDLRISGSNSVNTLDLYVDGDIFGEIDGTLTVLGDASINAGFGSYDIDLGSSNFWSRFDHYDSDFSESLSVEGYDVYLNLDGNVILGDSFVLNTLFIETLSGTGGGLGFAIGDVYQQSGAYVYAYELGVLSSGTVQLSDVDSYYIAIESQLGHTPIPGVVFNSVTNPAITTDPFGVIVQSYTDLYIDTVYEPFTFSESATGIHALDGHVYLETFGFSDIFLSEDVAVVDSTRTITAIAGHDIFQFNFARFDRGRSGFVSGPYTPVSIDGQHVNVFVPLDLETGEQSIRFNYGIGGDLSYSAQVTWADGSSQFFTPEALSALNPHISQPGAANPSLFQATIFDKPQPYSSEFLKSASLLNSTLTIFNDIGIQLFAQGGAKNLNAATITFFALVAREKVLIPLVVTEGMSPMSEPVTTAIEPPTTLANETIELSDFDDENLYLADSVAEVFTVRISGELELDRINWSGEFGPNDVLMIREAILNDPKFAPGIYSVRRVTAEGVTEELAHFEKTPPKVVDADDFELDDLLEQERKERSRNRDVVESDNGNRNNSSNQQGSTVEEAAPSESEQQAAPAPFDEGANLNPGTAAPVAPDLEQEVAPTPEDAAFDAEPVPVETARVHKHQAAMAAPFGLLAGSAALQRALRTIRRYRERNAGDSSNPSAEIRFDRSARRRRRIV